MRKKSFATTSKRDPKQLAYDMLDKPVVNPRYEGVTMREAVIKALKPEKPKPTSSDSNVQLDV